MALLKTSWSALLIGISLSTSIYPIPGASPIQKGFLAAAWRVRLGVRWERQIRNKCGMRQQARNHTRCHLILIQIRLCCVLSSSRSMVNTFFSILIQISAVCLRLAGRPSAHISRRLEPWEKNPSSMHLVASALFWCFWSLRRQICTHFLLKGSDSRRTAVKLTLLRIDCRVL